VGLLKPGDKMHVDILKMPHHGSDRNLDPIFFQRVSADHYVFSGNGEHGNPERETLQMLLNESGGEEFTIHLTYPSTRSTSNARRIGTKNSRRRRPERRRTRSEGERELVAQGAQPDELFRGT